MSVTSLTFEHYSRPEVKETIMKLSRDGAYCRWGNGDGHGWYKQESEHKFAYNLSNEMDYTALISQFRTLYWTLNYFDARAFEADYYKITSEERPILSRQWTQGYTLGIDIDKGHDCDIHDPAVKKAVEGMGQFYTDRLREYAPNSVHVLFSGGGIYVMLHHRILSDYFRRYTTSNNWEHMLNILITAYGYVIEDIRQDFFKAYPEHEGKVKPDSLNNSKRVFKSIFSIHLKQPYSVIPLEAEKVQIDFDKAKLPLSDTVIESGKLWYTTYDTDNTFLQFMRPYLLKAKDKLEHGQGGKYRDNPFTGSDISPTPIGAENWPPCIKNILALQSCGEGRTRALAFLASFLGQAAIPEEQAKQTFYTLASRWGATTSNIFDSYYQKMHAPTCDKLRADDNTGFSKGVSIKGLGVCKPDPRCLAVPGPRYYADRDANLERLKMRLSRKVGA